MITLTNTKYNTRQRVIIGGINSFDVFAKSLNIVFYIELIDSAGKKLDDKSLNQDRRVVYTVTNANRVDAKFDPVIQPEAKEGDESPALIGTGEYDYFWNLLQTIPLPTLVIQLAEKLKTRGIFN
jgi:hypothetical protein